MLFDAALDSVFGGAQSSDDYVYQTIRLLRNAQDTEWTEIPRIKNYWSDTQSERGPGQGQSPILYVWSPTTTSLDQFSMDGTRFDETAVVEVQAWSLSPELTQRLQSEVTHVLSKYLDDNRVNAPYSTVKPTGESDFREQTSRRQTDHYVMGVEIDLRGLSPTRDISGSGFEFSFDVGFT